MDLALYLGFFGIALVFLYLGYMKNNDADILKIAGFSLMLLLGSVLLTPNPISLEYETGKNITYIYGDNFTSYHWDYDFTANPATVNDVYLFHINEAKVYSTYKNQTFGFIIMVLACLGFANVFNSRRDKDD